MRQAFVIGTTMLLASLSTMAQASMSTYTVQALNKTTFDNLAVTVTFEGMGDNQQTWTKPLPSANKKHTTGKPDLKHKTKYNPFDYPYVTFKVTFPSSDGSTTHPYCQITVNNSGGRFTVLQDKASLGCNVEASDLTLTLSVLPNKAIAH